MAALPFIARRTLHAAMPDGSTRQVHLGLGVPYEVSVEEWACPVCLDGLHENLRHIHGVDSWQALQLASQLIAQLLTSFVAHGGKLYWDSGEEILVADLMPRLERS